LIAVAFATSGVREQIANKKRATDWSHDDIAAWNDHYPLCATGKEQSPIDIQTSQVSAFNRGQCRFIEKRVRIAEDECADS